MTTNQSELCFFGYPITPELFAQANKLIKDIESGVDPGDLSERAADTLIQVVDMGFYAYYQWPSEIADISSKIKKASDVGMRAVQKGIHFVVRKLLKNRELEDMQRLSGNMGQQLCVSKSDPTKAYVCFELDRGLYQKLMDVMQRVQDDPNLDAYRYDIIESIEALIATGIDAYYTTPVADANISKITRKAADLGINTVQKGSNAVVHRVFKGMEYKALLPLADYFETLLHADVRPFRADEDQVKKTTAPSRQELPA